MGSNMKEMGGRASFILLMMLTLVKTEELRGFVDKEVTFHTGHSQVRFLTVTFNEKEIAKSSNISKETWNDLLSSPYESRLRLINKDEPLIVLKSLRLNDTGVYRIFVVSQMGNRLNPEYTLTVYAPPEFVDGKFEIESQTSNTKCVQLRCGEFMFRGQPPVTLRWSTGDTTHEIRHCKDGTVNCSLEGPAAGDLQDKTAMYTPDEVSTGGGSGAVVAIGVVVIAVIIAIVVAS